MSKTKTLAATVALATLVALPTASQAGDCLGLDRVGNHVTRAVDGVGRAVTSVADRLLGLLRCDKHRT